MGIPTARLIAFLKDEDGVTAIEYGLMAGLIAAALVVAVAYIAGALDTNMQGVADKFPGAS
jgi:pilus assembly protein Flp/PilA